MPEIKVNFEETMLHKYERSFNLVSKQNNILSFYLYVYRMHRHQL